MKSEKIVVCGGGGFIGGHLIADLQRQGHTHLRAVDIKLKKLLGWEPNVRLRDGLEKTYRWIHDPMRQKKA
jgi:nucleoside-diphosphate-sugar epimerase